MKEKTKDKFKRVSCEEHYLWRWHTIMIFKKITFLFVLLIFLTSCEKEDNSICI